MGRVPAEAGTGRREAGRWERGRLQAKHNMQRYHWRKEATGGLDQRGGNEGQTRRQMLLGVKKGRWVRRGKVGSREWRDAGAREVRLHRGKPGRPPTAGKAGGGQPVVRGARGKWGQTVRADEG